MQEIAQYSAHNLVEYIKFSQNPISPILLSGNLISLSFSLRYKAIVTKV